MECPHCAEEVEIEPENGSVFECPLCASDFEVESNPAAEVDYSDHFWGPALDTSYPEHCLNYIARVDGELPENRLIQVSSDSHSERGFAVFMILCILTIPVLIIIILVHVLQNSNREHQKFLWVRKWGHYLDPLENAIITITDFKNGPYPTQVAYLEGPLGISKISGGNDDPTYYSLTLNSKQRLCFDYKKQAERCRENIKAALR